MGSEKEMGLRGLREQTAGRPKHWFWTLAASLLCVAAFVAISLHNYFPHTYLIGDSTYYAAAAVSLMADQDLKLENNLRGGLGHHGGFVSLGVEGEWRPKHPVLMPVVTVPFILAFGGVGLLIFNLTVMTLLVAATHRLALRGSGPVSATTATVVTCLLTFVVAYAYNYSPDAFAALPAVIALLFLLDGKPLGAGLMAGLAFAAKPAHVLFVAVSMAAAWFQGGQREATRFAAGVLPAVVAVMVYNTILFGGPLLSGYDRILEAGPVPRTVSQRGDFTLAGAPANLSAEILDPKHGLLYTAPSVLVGLAGLLALWRRKPMLAVLPVALLLVYLLFFATFIPWRASHFGNRYLFIPVVVSALPLAALLHQAGRRRREVGYSPPSLPAGSAASG
jgi:hypothetical protein